MSTNLEKPSCKIYLSLIQRHFYHLKIKGSGGFWFRSSVLQSFYCALFRVYCTCKTVSTDVSIILAKDASILVSVAHKHEHKHMCKQVKTGST